MPNAKSFLKSDSLSKITINMQDADTQTENAETEAEQTTTIPTLSDPGSPTNHETGDEQNDAIHKPETQGEYAISWGEDSTVDASTRDVITGLGKELGLPADKLGEFVGKMEAHFNGISESVQAEATKQLQEKETALRKEWGRDYDDKLRGACNMAVRICAKAGVEPAVFEELGIESHPDMMRVFGAIAQVMGEARLPAAEATTSANRAEAMRIRTDPSHPLYKAYHDPSNPKAFLAAQDRYKALTQ